MPNYPAPAAGLTRPGLGDVVEFYSEDWHGVIFGKINSMYLDRNLDVVEYWVEHIDNAMFLPKNHISTLRAGNIPLPKIAKPKFSNGECVVFKDGGRTWLLVVKEAQCYVSAGEVAWEYSMEDKDKLGNEIPWDEPCKEKSLKRFKV